MKSLDFRTALLPSLASVLFLALSGCSCGASSSPVDANDGVGDAGEGATSDLFCEPHGHCWQNPQPQGNFLYGVWGTSDTNAYAVGARGTIMHFDGTIWTHEISNTRVTLQAIWGTGPDNIYAIGGEGTVVHFDGNSWQSESITTHNLLAISGNGPDHIVVVGEGAVIMQFDGTAWTTEPTAFSGRLSGVLVADNDTVIAVGDNNALGTIVRWNGLEWALERDDLEPLQAVWGTASSDLYAAGQGGTVYHYDGQWSLSTNTLGSNLFAMSGQGADVYVGGGLNTLAMWDGDQWTELPAIPEPTYNIYGVWAASSGAVFIVGQVGFLAKWDGSSWTRYDIGHRDTIQTLWGSAADNVYAAGDDGHLSHYDGTAWSMETIPDSVSAEWLRSLWASGPNDVFAVGYGGTILHYDGTVPNTWTLMDSGTSGLIDGLWGTGPQDVFAGGEQTMLHYGTDNQWTPMPMPPEMTGDIITIWGSSSTDVFAATHPGFFGNDPSEVLHYDGLDWSLLPDTPPMKILAMWGSGPADLYVTGADLEVADGGAIWHYDGAQWTDHTPAAAIERSFEVQAIWGTDATNIYAGGSWGWILHYDGTEWTRLFNYSQLPINALWGPNDDHIFAAGQAGGIMYRQPVVSQ